MASREFDIVIFGATGFTGQLVVEYYVKTYGTPSKDFKWAIAGRSQSKLESVKKDMEKQVAGAKDVPTIICDSNNMNDLNALAKRTKVVVTTVGPYAKYGSNLVAACASNGTHYADLTGETPWIADMIKAHEAKAKQSGACILHCCGFDSEPSDLGVHIMYKELKKRNLTPTSIRFVVGPSNGGVSGGTVHSLAGVIKSGRVRDLANPYLLLAGGKRQGVTIVEPKGVSWDKDLKRWNAPFIMAGINTRIVARSAALLGREPFNYMETMSFTGNFLGMMQACFVTFSLLCIIFFMSIPPFRWMVLKLVPPGSGPSETQRRNGFAEIYLVGKGMDREGKESTIKGTIRIAGDPGYQETAKMIAETGMALAKDKVVTGPGILTPAAALGDTLLQRLNNRNLTFTIDQ